MNWVADFRPRSYRALAWQPVFQESERPVT